MNKNIKLILNYVIGPLLFCILVYSIYMQVQRQPDWRTSIEKSWEAFTGAAPWKIISVLLLMVINWTLEARKWQLAITRIQPISLVTSFKATLAGTTLGFFTLNRMGEYLGRVWYIEEGKRMQAVSLTLVCSMAQLLVTLGAGIAGLAFMKRQLASSITGSASLILWYSVVQYASILAICILALLYFRLYWLVRLIKKIPLIDKWVRYIRVLENFNATQLLKMLSLSLARYGVFILQYYLLFDLFAVEINWWQTFWSISVVFLVLAIVPTIAFLTELSIRWKASMELVKLFSDNVIGILATSFTIWIINLVIPALVGSLLILGIKFFRSK